MRRVGFELIRFFVSIRGVGNGVASANPLRDPFQIVIKYFKYFEGAEAVNDLPRRALNAEPSVLH
jgi:hypothetical protein